MAEELRARVNHEAGKELVGSIRFTVSQRVERRDQEAEVRRNARRRYGGDFVEPSPLTDEERAAVERSVESIRAPQLREAALRATVADLEWKKALEESAQTD